MSRPTVTQSSFKMLCCFHVHYHPHYVCLCNVVPDPQFDRGSYIVPENNHIAPLCIDVGVVLLQETTYIISSMHRDPPQAQG